VKPNLFSLPSLLLFLGVTAWSTPQSSIGAVQLVGTIASDVTISDYIKKDLSPVTQVHAARIFTEYERRGFFRIGLLPVPVVENVSIIIRSADCLTNNMFEARFWNRPGMGVRRLKFRNVEIKLFGEKQPRLRADGAQVGREGAIELSNVSLPNSSEQSTPIPHATLQVNGSAIGWLR